MRLLWRVLPASIVCLSFALGCSSDPLGSIVGDDPSPATDASTPIDSAPDAAIDPPLDAATVLDSASISDAAIVSDAAVVTDAALLPDSSASLYDLATPPDLAQPVDFAWADLANPPVAGHPRLWITQADLPRLRDWANPSRPHANPMWTQSFAQLISQANNLYSGNAKSFFPPGLSGAPNPTWPDNGTSGVGAPYTETYAEFYAFLSLVAATQAERDTYAQRARNLLMYVMNAAANCPPPPSPLPPNYTAPPFCDSVFAIYNRANYDGEAWGLIVDWIYPSLTATDKSTIRKVFLQWSDVIAHSWVAPPANTRGVALLTNKYANGQRQDRWAANNYYSGTNRNLALMAASFDAVDDPGGQLGAYVDYYLDIILYQQFAIYEDPATVAAAYKLSAADIAASDKLGLASGGLPVEGFLYGHSMAYVFEALFALHTAGLDDLTKHGPQAGFIRSHYWDLLVDGFLHSLPPAPIKPGAPFQWLPAVYQPASYGDLLYDYITDYDYLPLFSVLATYDARAGVTQRLAKDRWLGSQVMPGGSANLYTLVGSAWTNSLSTTAILAFMAFDPDQSLPTAKDDPRPSMSTSFYAQPIGRLLARTDWSVNESWFNHVCGWASINHQYGNCGQFEFFRKGEWLTKERSGYDNGKYPAPAYGYAPDYHNILGLQNDFTGVNLASLRVDEMAELERGGQWNNDANAGDPNTVASTGNGYAFAQDVSTNLYNRVPNKYNPATGASTAVTHASRSILWIEPDHIVVYDRAATKASGYFKRFNLVLDQATDANRNPVPPTITPQSIPVMGGVGGSPPIAGNVIKATTPSGQSLFVQSLLPEAQKATVSLVEPFYPVAWLEPSQNGPIVNSAPGESGYHLQIEEPSKPMTARFLNVLQGADAGQMADPVTLIHTNSGTALDGVAIQRAAGTVVVMFLRDLSSAASLSSATWPLAPNVSLTYVADLKPATPYKVNVQNGVVTLSADPSAAGNAVTTDGAGVLRF